MSSEKKPLVRTKKDFKIVSEKTVYNGYLQVKSYNVSYQRFEGGWSQELSREVLMRGDVAGVLLYDPDLNKVVLIEQFRIGAIEDKKTPWLLECVAGILDANESIEELAIRETREEAGMEILELHPICSYWCSPGAYSERVHLFCGRVDSTKASGVHGLEEEGEDIKVHVIKSEKAFEMVRNGEINHALSIIALQWLELNYK